MCVRSALSFTLARRMGFANCERTISTIRAGGLERQSFRMVVGQFFVRKLLELSKSCPAKRQPLIGCIVLQPRLDNCALLISSATKWTGVAKRTFYELSRARRLICEQSPCSPAIYAVSKRSGTIRVLVFASHTQTSQTASTRVGCGSVNIDKNTNPWPNSHGAARRVWNPPYIGCLWCSHIYVHMHVRCAHKLTHTPTHTWAHSHVIHSRNSRLN